MTAIDHRLIDLLVCPLCKSGLRMLRDAEGRPRAMGCVADRLAFPLRDGIPVMLESQAQAWDPSDAAATPWAAPAAAAS